MSRWPAAAVAVVALLVLTAQPAAAVVVAGVHTTDTDFNTANTLSNVTVTGTGKPADVTLGSQTTQVESFEDNDLAEYQDTTSWSVVTANPTDGTYHLESGSGVSPTTAASGFPPYEKGQGNYTADVHLQGSNDAEIWFGVDDPDHAIVIRVGPNSIELITYDNGRVTEATTTTSVPTTEYLTVDIDWDTDDTVAATVREEDSGALVGSVTGSETQLQGNEGNGIGWNADAAGVQFDNARITDAQTNSKGTYISANYSVTGVQDAWTNMTLQNAAAVVTWQGSNGQQWYNLDSQVYSSSGNYTASLINTQLDTYRVNVTFVRQSGTTNAQLHDEGIRARDANLNIWNESAPDQQVTAPTEGTFFGTEEYVESGSTTSGSLDITTLPTNQSYVVRVRSTGYESRRLFIEDPTAEQDIYMLPNNATTVDIVFRLDDNTGNYPPGETVLSVQRALNKSDTTRYRTITSDQFGASNEFAVTLEQDIRYRLVVENADGDTRVLGGYIASGDDPDAVLPIGEVIARGDSEGDVAFNAALETDPGRIVMRYDDRQNATELLYLNVTNLDTGTSIRQNTSVAGPYGTYQETVILPPGELANHTYRVEYHAVRGEAADRAGTRTVGGIPEFMDRFELGSNVAFLLASALIVATAGLVGIVSVEAAAIATPAVATLVTWGGLIAIPLPLLAVAGGLGVIVAGTGAYS